MKKALLLCATHNDLGTIRALKELGYYIIVTGKIEGLPGELMCDKYIKADYSDKEMILEIAENEQVDAIVQCCNDFGVYTAAYVAEKLGLPGYDSFETTLLLHNKDRFKKFARENDLLVIESTGFSSIDDAFSYVRGVKYPIIVKPVDASAGNGIRRADKYDDAIKAIEYAFNNSREKRIVIEPFIRGSQHGFCTFLIDRKVVAVCSNNEFSFENPYRVEIDTFPATGYSNIKDVLINQVELIAEKLCLCDGIFHMQYLLDESGPHIMEVMRRILGNMYHVPGNSLCGIDFEYWETRTRCGLSLLDFPKDVNQKNFYAYKTILATSDGIIEEIIIPEKYHKYITSEYYLKSVGDKIEHHLSTPVGFLFMKFSTEEEMKKVLIDDYESNFVKISKS